MSLTCSFFLTDDPYAPFFEEGSSYSQPSEGAAGTSQGSELPRPKGSGSDEVAPPRSFWRCGDHKRGAVGR